MENFVLVGLFPEPGAINRPLISEWLQFSMELILLLAIFFRFFCRRLLRPGHKLPHVWETEIDKIWVITGNGISIRFRSNINNAKVLMIVYLKSLIFIAILRGKLGKIYSQNLKRINFSIWVKENFRSSLGQLCYKFRSSVIVFGRHWWSDDGEFRTLKLTSILPKYQRLLMFN